jgi:hypothetical protein
MKSAGLITAMIVAGVLGATQAGCVLGPTALEISRPRYNEVIERTTSEQLLLNLVRLQYRESPLFLGVENVSTQFEFGEAADISGTLNEGPNPINPDQLGLGAAVGYEERPTVTFTPLQGRDFVSQLLAPLSLDSIVLLMHSGWSADRVLRLTVQTMNGLDNAATASGPTPARAPAYKDFAQVSGLLRQLQQKDLLQIGYERREDSAGVALPLQVATVADIVDAKSQGYSVRADLDAQTLILTGSSQVPVWRISPAAAETPELKEIIELLGLEPGQASYEIQLSIAGEPDPSAPPGHRKRIDLATRSMMGALFYLSQAVEVPEAHQEKGVVTVTRTGDDEPFDWSLVTGDLLRIRSQRIRPINAAVAVYHRGYWYYIDDADLNSKSTFGFLSQLFALQAGGVEAKAPVLTLPIGG